MYFPKPSLNENDMAIIERGDTAAHSIEAGQYVSWHGKTGKAKAAILQGATLEDTLFDYDEDGAINELNASIVNYDFSGQPVFLGNYNGHNYYRLTKELWYGGIPEGSFRTAYTAGKNYRVISLTGTFYCDGEYMRSGNFQVRYIPSSGNVNVYQTLTAQYAVYCVGIEMIYYI